MVARNIRSDNMIDHFSVELSVCRDAILLAIEQGFLNVAIETDCKKVKHAWDSDKDDTYVGFQLPQDRCEISSPIFRVLEHF